VNRMRNNQVNSAIKQAMWVMAIAFTLLGSRPAAAQGCLAPCKVIYVFGTNQNDGSYPGNWLTADAAGNLYGVTVSGGATGYGTVYEVSPQSGGGWTEQVLYSFQNNGQDGYYSNAKLIFDKSGNIYGSTTEGGAYGGGTVFEMSPQSGGGWNEQVLYSFGANAGDGSYTTGALTFDTAGNLYGTCYYGGNYGGGTIYELSPQSGGGWTETVIHAFSGADGVQPDAAVTIDPAGNLYTPTNSGGANGSGTVFELSPQSGGGWTGQVIYEALPKGGTLGIFNALNLDAAGNLYGASYYGGGGEGTVSELSPQAGGGLWHEHTLHRFKNNGRDGINPNGDNAIDSAGNIYGTTEIGGLHGFGTVFELSPQPNGTWSEKVLSFVSNSGFIAGVILGPDGNLYGLTQDYVFEIALPQ